MPDEPISLSLHLIKVNELARQGRLREAEALLAPYGATPENSIALQTLAALATKAGNQARALALWKALQQRDPKNPEAREMIAAIETWMARPAWFRFLPAGAAAAVVLLIGVVWWTTSQPAPHPLAPATTAVPTPAAGAPTSSAPTARPAAPVAAPPSDAPPVRFQLPSAPTKPKKN
jgi:hypothetical protein